MLINFMKKGDYGCHYGLRFVIYSLFLSLFSCLSPFVLINFLFSLFLLFPSSSYSSSLPLSLPPLLFFPFPFYPPLLFFLPSPFSPPLLFFLSFSSSPSPSLLFFLLSSSSPFLLRFLLFSFPFIRQVTRTRKVYGFHTPHLRSK